MLRAMLPLGKVPQIWACPIPSPHVSRDGGTAGAERTIGLINLLLFLLTSWDLERALPWVGSQHIPPPRQ